jgi:MATE family multidrug resistance protein
MHAQPAVPAPAPPPPHQHATSAGTGPTAAPNPAAQAYGARNYRSLGTALQRALLICWLTCLPIALLWQHVEPLLLRLGQQPEIAAGAAGYLAILTPSLFFCAVQETVKRYLMAQGVVTAPMLATIVTTVTAPAYYYLLMYRFGLGLDGAAWALNLCQMQQSMALVAYTAYRDLGLRGSPQQTFHGWSLEAVQGWGRYLGYAVPAAIMLCMEWWVYEVVIFIAGLLPDAKVEVGVMGLCFQVSCW